MRIRRVEARRVSIPLREPATFATRTVRERDYTVVEIETEEGVVGFGICWFHHPALIIDRYLKPLVEGQDLTAYQGIWSLMYRELYRERKGAAICAISAVDIAIWDALGKSYRRPVYKLLGGMRDRVPCYASGGYYRAGKGLEGLHEEMRGYAEEGFRAVKMKVGRVGLEEDLERLRVVKEAIGEEAWVAVDANNAYNRYEAVKAGRAFESRGVAWFEEPVWPDDVEGAAHVASVLDVPIASGELEYTRYGFRELIKRGAVDIIQPDVTFCGGVTEFLKIAALAEAENIPVAPHAWHDLHAHLVAAIPNGLTVEYFAREADIMKETELYKETLRPRDGYLHLPDRPGFGIEIDEEALTKYSA